MIGQSQPLPPRTAAADDPVAAASYRVDEAVHPHAVERPLTARDVRRIATAGYPLWEPLDVMQLRNRRITVGYSDLSERMAALLSRHDGQRDANWCTFAAWTSKTVGTWIERDVAPAPLLMQLKSWPKPVAGKVIELTQWLLQRENGASYRCLAAGNRFVFLEIAQSVALFVECFEGVDDDPDEQRWGEYWGEMSARVADLSRLDPSWVLTEAPEPEELRLGLRQYYEALFCDDRKRRAELILAGTLLMGAYEQRRLDGYVDASLALFTERAMRQLVRHRRGELGPGPLRWLSAGYSRLMTLGLVLDLPDERIFVGRPLPPPPDAPLFPPDLEVITLPLLQALLTRWDASDGRDERRRAHEWSDLDDRMSFITNLFRSRQQRAAMFQHPFPPEAEDELLAGRVPAPVDGA
ncbi:MAG TPA: hypothetical protein VF743_08585 [Acidimicrobiales bacterium]